MYALDVREWLDWVDETRQSKKKVLGWYTIDLLCGALPCVSVRARRHTPRKRSKKIDSRSPAARRRRRSRPRKARPLWIRCHTPKRPAHVPNPKRLHPQNVPRGALTWLGPGLGRAPAGVGGRPRTTAWHSPAAAAVVGGKNGITLLICDDFTLALLSLLLRVGACHRKASQPTGAGGGWGWKYKGLVWGVRSIRKRPRPSRRSSIRFHAPAAASPAASLMPRATALLPLGRLTRAPPHHHHHTTITHRGLKRRGGDTGTPHPSMNGTA